jgi:hypothetical protein
MEAREEEDMVTRGLILIALIGLLFSACARTEELPDQWGASFKSAKDNQILNPEAGEDLKPVTEFDGQAAETTSEKYREGFKRQPPRTIYSISIGGIGQR